MKTLFISIRLFLVLTVLCGVIYPIFLLGIGQIIFPQNTNGSLIFKNKQLIGSSLIGQSFTQPDFFWGRPSAVNNNPMPSGASNMNPIGEKLENVIILRLDTIRKYHENSDINSIPKDLLFASGSGVDPHISPEAAYFQINRVAEYRNFNKDQTNKLKLLIDSLTEGRDLFVFGEPRINVLHLNNKLLEIQ